MSQNLSILQNFRSDLVRREPFPYFVIEQALPVDLYEHLQRQYPSAETIFAHNTRKRSEKTMASNTRYDIPASVVRTNPQLDIGMWRDFVIYHTSQEFLDELLDKLGNTIGLRYEWLLDKMRKKAPNGRPRAGVRQHQDKAGSCEIALDCQVGMNSPVSARPTTVKSLHLDNSAELFAGLFYLRESKDDSTGGDLEIFRWKKDVKMSFYDKRSIRSEHAERVDVVPYVANRFVWLLNDLDAIHGVSVRDMTRFTRRLVNIIAEVYPTVERLFDERPYAESKGLLRRIFAGARP